MRAAVASDEHERAARLREILVGSQLPVMTVEEAALVLRNSRRTVFKLIDEGELVKTERRPGRETLVTKSSVMAYLGSLHGGGSGRPARRRRRPSFVASSGVPRPRE